ncbi:acyl-CoA dehydrogenase family protein [Nocardioides pyridinolyticus]
MRVDLTPAQREIAYGAREFFEAEYDVERLRLDWESNGRVDEAAWRKLASMGFFGLPVPERDGGLGQGVVELALVVEESGRAAYSAPLLETLAAVPTLVDAGPSADMWLESIVAGDRCAVVALPGQRHAAGFDRPAWVLAGSDNSLSIIDAKSVPQQRLASIDAARPIFALPDSSAEATRLAGSDAAARLEATVLTLTAAYLLGLSARLLELTVLYTEQRFQFGRAIGSFQAVKHKLADVATGVELARPSMWVAAHRIDRNDPQAPLSALVAKAFATRIARLANEAALQCHGAMGFTMEFDLHMWLKRGKVMEQFYGAPTAVTSRIAAELLATPSADLGVRP